MRLSWPLLVVIVSHMPLLYVPLIKACARHSSSTPPALRRMSRRMGRQRGYSDANMARHHVPPTKPARAPEHNARFAWQYV